MGCSESEESGRRRPTGVAFKWRGEKGCRELREENDISIYRRG
jgi:hypothetical protein